MTTKRDFFRFSEPVYCDIPGGCASLEKKRTGDVNLMRRDLVSSKLKFLFGLRWWKG